MPFPQVGFAFQRIETALSMIVSNLNGLSGLAAQTERLDALFKGAAPFCLPRPILAAMTAAALSQSPPPGGYIILARNARLLIDPVEVQGREGSR
jgi:hypothetical protein